MSTLSTELRNKLEKVVTAGRNLSEKAAKAALEALAVAHHEPFPHMTPGQRTLRNQLRARARQVGDTQDAKGQLSLTHLVHECAYEHWHRMLFARFLAENNLLMLIEDGEKPVAVSLDDCKELAKEAKTDLWTLAGRCAQKMLPKIFRPDDPLLQVTLARENQIELERELDKLSAAVFTAGDSLGWCYQFWQSDQKEIVNKSGKKIGADELPAVTQLFTEDYMVEFLLHNTLGAWWTAKRCAEGKNQPLTFPYLRLKEDGTPAAGAFEGWPKTVKELRLLDPCMGSGHFLVFALLILVRMRMEEEKLSAAEACMAVLRDNLFGLELDARCTQIGAFNLALAAWKLAGYQTLPPLNLACSGLGVNAREADWLAIAGDNGKLQRGMQQLYQLFRQAPVLGSLINPRALGGDLLVADFHELQPLLEQAMQREKADDAHELAVTAHGVARAAEILASQFTLVATNVPFKETKQLVIPLQEHIHANFKEGRINLATAFLLRIRQFLKNDAAAAVVTPHEWLFLKTYTPTRETMLRRSTWRVLADLGEHAFESAQAAGAFTALISFTNAMPGEANEYAGWDVTKLKMPGDKARGLLESLPLLVRQADQLKNPDARIGLSAASDLPLLSKYAGSYVGLQNGDTPRFVFCFWEIPALDSVWNCFELPCDLPKAFGGREGMLRWENGVGVLASAPYARVQGTEAWGKQGVAIRQTRTLPATRYTGDLYDQSSAAIIPHNPAHLPAIWAYCSSPQFHDDVRKIDKKKNVTNATLVKVPFDLAHWQQVAAEKYPGGLPKPFSSDPTQWLFNGHPKGSTSPLHVAVARLLGYRWPRQTGSSFHDCPALDADGLESFVDDDGIVCLPSVRGKEPAADRLRKLLRAAYGAEWKATTELELIYATGSKATDLEEWLRNDFFDQHREMFYQRPFIWHIWDGRKRDGFHALVNYHALAGAKGRQTLESLTHSYLGDWITRQKDGVKRDEEGADERGAAALALKEILEAILAGERPYDLFVRWKPLRQQPIAWEPDINDGVRMNIRPFLISDVAGGKKGAGILRCKPGIGWEADRGSEPDAVKDDYPWMWNWDGEEEDFNGGEKFDGTRWNDCHYTIACKQAARERK